MSLQWRGHEWTCIYHHVVGVGVGEQLRQPGFATDQRPKLILAKDKAVCHQLFFILVLQKSSLKLTKYMLAVSEFNTQYLT